MPKLQTPWRRSLQSITVPLGQDGYSQKEDLACLQNDCTSLGHLSTDTGTPWWSSDGPRLGNGGLFLSLCSGRGAALGLDRAIDKLLSLLSSRLEQTNLHTGSQVWRTTIQPHRSILHSEGHPPWTLWLLPAHGFARNPSQGLEALTSHLWPFTD